MGTLIATTNSQDLYGSPSVSARDTAAWQTAFEHAQYVWLYGNRGYTGARIIWTSSLHAYFVHHFRLIGLRSSFRGSKLVPGGGLYVEDVGGIRTPEPGSVRDMTPHRKAGNRWQQAGSMRRPTISPRGALASAKTPVSRVPPLMSMACS